MGKATQKTIKFFVATLFLCGTVALIDASFNPVHAAFGVQKPGPKIK